MNIAFAQPAWACAGGAVLLLAALLLWRARFRSWRWRVSGILLPALSAALIALALSGPSIFLGDAPVAVFIDLSPSTRTLPWRDPAWLRQLVARRLSANRSVSVIAFAPGDARPLLQDVTAHDAQAWPASWPTPILEALQSIRSAAPSPIEPALTWRSAGTANFAHLARWIFTDGLFVDPGAPPDVAWTIVHPPSVDVAVHDLLVRPADGSTAEIPEVEVLVQVRAVGWTGDAPPAEAPPPLRARLQLQRDGTPIADETVEFHAAPSGPRTFLDAARWISIRDRPPPAQQNLPHRYDATISLVQGAARTATGDLWPENDRSMALFVPPAPLRILVLSNGNRSDTFQPFPGAATLVPIDRFIPDVQRLTQEGWQAVVLDDLPAQNTGPATPISSASALALDHFVRDTGAGLLIAGSEHAFGPGRYGEGTPAADTLEALSPVWSHPHQGEFLHVVLLLDASASMNEPVTNPAGTQTKFRALARGIDQSLQLLTPDDRVSVITFNDHPHLLADGARSAVAESLRRELASTEPAGPTSPDAALPDLKSALSRPANRTLILLITDGEIPTMSTDAWKPILTRPNNRFAVIAPESPKSALTQVVAAIPDTTWIKTQDAAVWADHLREIIGDQVRGTVEHTPLPWQTTDAILPPIAGTINTWTHVWSKPESRLWAIGKSPDVPLAAIVQRGLGKVAALAMADDGSPAYQALQGHLLREIAASPGDRRFTLSADRIPNGTWRLTANGIGDAGFLNGESLTVKLLTDADTPTIPLPQTGPGRYQATLPVTGPFSAIVTRPGAAQELVARINTAAVETSEWPASVDHTFAGGPILLPASFDDPARWNPAPFPHTQLPATLCWIGALLAALAALWTRR